MNRQQAKYDEIRLCQEGIKRIRIAIRDGDENSEAVARDYEMILALIMPCFQRFANKVFLKRFGPYAAEEAAHLMVAKMIDAIRRPSYRSLETHFSSALREYLSMYCVTFVKTVECDIHH